MKCLFIFMFGLLSATSAMGNRDEVKIKLLQAHFEEANDNIFDDDVRGDGSQKCKLWWGSSFGQTKLFFDAAVNRSSPDFDSKFPKEHEFKRYISWDGMANLSTFFAGVQYFPEQKELTTLVDIPGAGRTTFSVRKKNNFLFFKVASSGYQDLTANTIRYGYCWFELK